MPVIHFDHWDRDDIEVKLLLKGGGCENVNAQYALPMDLEHLGRADRSLEGCASVCCTRSGRRRQGLQPRRRRRVCGRDRTAGYQHAKEHCSARWTTLNATPDW